MTEYKPGTRVKITIEGDVYNDSQEVISVITGNSGGPLIIGKFRNGVDIEEILPLEPPTGSIVVVKNKDGLLFSATNIGDNCWRYNYDGFYHSWSTICRHEIIAIFEQDKS